MKIKRGDIWLINLDPTIGREISKTRPALVLSRSDYNEVAETVTVIPISKGRYIRSFHVFMKKLKEGSHAVIPQIRVASKKRLIKKMSSVSDDEIQELEDKLLRYLKIG